MKLTYSPRAFLWASLTCLALAGSACGEEEDSVSPRRDAGTDVDVDPIKGDGSVAQCMSAETRTCTCEGSTKKGKNACRSGKWSSICAGCPTENDDKPVASNLCKAGYYKGEFTGLYFPGFAGGGIAMSPLPVNIAGKPLGDIPALAFTLKEESTNVGEFQTFSVGGGCMNGSAQAFGVIDNPFVARITGNLDCRTGFFDGWLQGQYNLINTGVLFNFEGPLTAQFELPQTLSEGDWKVDEPAALLGGSQGGGSGTWGAEWAADDAPNLAMDPCAAIPVSDGGMPRPSTPKPDAGTSTKDAGT